MVEVVTLGCRINSYESEVLKEKLGNLDNVIIVNTCAVTGEAERQCRQTIRKLRKENPDAKIVVTGCAAQVATQKFADMPEVDLVLGNKEKAEIENYIDSQEKEVVSDIFNYDSYDKYIITGFEGRHKAFVQIQQGCNHRCTYCIIPYARGNNRSVKEEVPDEAYIVPLDKAAVKREGSDVSIITYGYMVQESLKAAEDLAKEGINAEVVDLRTVSPLQR